MVTVGFWWDPSAQEGGTGGWTSSWKLACLGYIARPQQRWWEGSGENKGREFAVDQKPQM